MRFKDKDIRELLLPFLSSHHWFDIDPIAIEELGINRGYCIADLVVVTDKLFGYEIKSDYDSLERLPRQVQEYDKVFDRSVLVCTSRFIKESRKLLKSWWGIIEVNPKGSLKWVRKSKTNHRQKIKVISQLIWRDLAFEFLKRNKIKAYKSWRASKLLRIIHEEFSNSEIKTEVVRLLKERYSGHAQYEVVGRKRSINLKEVY